MPPATAFPAATGGCATCCAQALLGQLSLGGGQPPPTISMEDFLRREQRVRQEERLRLEEKQLREEKLRREERVRQEERLRREERARKEERRRRELEEERLRQEERLRIEERIREEQRLSFEARLEEQRRQRLERAAARENRRTAPLQRPSPAGAGRAKDGHRSRCWSGPYRQLSRRGLDQGPPKDRCPAQVLSRMGSQDRLRPSALRDPRDSERPAASIRGIQSPRPLG
ncbi:hypothetical protein MTO96_048362 [Rhipicephalus appendiculatus]